MKRKKTSTSIILLLCAFAFFASCDNSGPDDGIVTWAKAYGTAAGGEEFPLKIVPAVDGGFVLLGSQNDIVKLNGDGIVRWQKKFNDGLELFELESLAETPEGGLVVLGHSGLDSDILLKLDSDGNELWRKGSSGLGMSDHYLVDVDRKTGSIFLYYFMSDFFVVMKKDASGNTLWSKRLNVPYASPYFSIRATADGGCIVAQSVYILYADDSYSTLPVAVKLSAGGAVEWQKTFGPSGGIKELVYGQNYDSFVSVEQTQDGGYLFAGTSTWGSTVWVVRVDASGNMQWGKELSSVISKSYTAIREYSMIGAYPVADGGCAVAGTAMVETNVGLPQVTGYLTRTIDQAAWIIKLTAGGAMSWQKSYREKSETFTTTEEMAGLILERDVFVTITRNLMDLRSFAPVSGGGFVGAGSTKMYGLGYYDYTVLKLNSKGAIADTALKVSTRKATVKDLAFKVREESMSCVDFAAEAAVLPGMTVAELAYGVTGI